jgi:hypothetical protein
MENTMRPLFAFRNVRHVGLPALALMAFIPLTAARADTLVQVTSGSGSTDSFAGQSVTTPSGGPFNNLSFNFFDPSSGNPLADGTLFLLSKEYSSSESANDTPANLSSSTPGFIAQSTGITGGVYQFDPSVTLQGNTQYFFYSNGNHDISFQATGNPYAGGSFYAAPSGVLAYVISPNADVNFRLSGQVAVPLPSAAALGISLLPLGLMARALRRRA